MHHDEVVKMIQTAIKQRHLLIFVYEELPRRVEPHHYGFLGYDLQVHGYQVGGQCHTGATPSWKNFKLAKMTHVSIDRESVFHIRHDYNKEGANYSSIIVSVD